MVKATLSGNFKAVALPEPNTVVARCYSLVELGTVPNVFKGVVQGKIRKIYVTWEFPTLMAVFNDDRGEEPFVIGMELTVSTNKESNLAKLISHWRNKPLTPEEEQGFDVNQMVGKTAMISFIHALKKKYLGQTITEVTNENTVLKFNGIMPKPKEVACAPMMNPEMIWDWDIQKVNFNSELWMRIPKWLRTKIRTSDEFIVLGYDPEAVQGQGQAPAGQAAAPGAETEPMDEDGW